jgi:hypothetical protein
MSSLPWVADEPCSDMVGRLALYTDLPDRQGSPPARGA